ncbi:methyltransferase [Actinophytocola oryzae]|uniref:O-methyltransferase n=1 Tax=Actinophytocola oryzae TaxID=502181 RepID=A0A4R7VHW3_9PSEU|nr:methyltransferase [Actinophytocola oryzae]TDV48953.1 O-methyltransferase [Actinophytocola oryzae]
MADKELSSARPTTSSVVAAYDWGALGHVVDVGGGDGMLLIALLNEYQTLRGTVVDLPDTAETARKMLDAAGLANRGDVVAGDFFGALPTGAEGYLLCSVLHQWQDEDARTILRNCAKAAGEDGALFVIETIPQADHATAPPRTTTPDPAPNPATAATADETTAPAADPATDEPTDPTPDGTTTGAASSPNPGGHARDLTELTLLAESAELTVAAVHTAGTVAILELAVP